MLPDDPRRERFERLLAAVHDPLRRYLYRRVEPDAVDDVLAESLATLWRRLADVPADAELPWAYGVARRCLANHRRSAERRLHLVRRLAGAADRAVPLPDDGGHPELTDALATLPPADQEVLRLWAWEELAPREIAQVLDITPNAASIRLHRATGRLRAALGKTGGPTGQTASRHGAEVDR